MPAVKSPSKTVQQRDFSRGLVRAGSRPGIPDEGLWDAVNLQVIGPGQLRTLVNPAAAVATLSGIVSLWGVILKIGGSEVSRLITIHSDGSVRAVTPSTGAVTVVAAASSLSGAARLTTWQDTHVLFADPTNGYASWDGTNYVAYPATFTGSTVSGSATLTWTGGATPAAALVASMSIAGTGIPAGTTIIAVAGTAITMSANATATGSITVTVGTAAPTSARDVAVFQGRAWLLTGDRGITFTGPASFTTFETVYAAGATTLTDPSFPGTIVTLRSAMELLWLIGAAAINTISNVQVSGGVTTFQNENLVANIGSPWAASVQPLFRTMVFLAKHGVYAILGATPQKLSDALDGLFPDVAPLSGNAPAAVFVLNGILVYATLVNVGADRHLLVYSRPSWAKAEQGSSLLWITTLIDAATGEPQAWGTDGAGVFQLFAAAQGTFRMQTKLFDFGQFTQEKQILRTALEAEFTGTVTPSLSLAVENERAQSTALTAITITEMTWTNSTAGPVTWINSTGGPVTWIPQGHLLLWSQVRFAGNLLGWLLTGTSSPLTIGAIAAEVNLLGEWTK